LVLHSQNSRTILQSQFIFGKGSAADFGFLPEVLHQSFSTVSLFRSCLSLGSIGRSHPSAFLQSMRAEGWSVFLVRGPLPMASRALPGRGQWIPLAAIGPNGCRPGTYTPPQNTLDEEQQLQQLLRQQQQEQAAAQGGWQEWGVQIVPSPHQSQPQQPIVGIESVPLCSPIREYIYQ
jgi:hypothetical protein